MIAHTFREVAASGDGEPDRNRESRLEELRGRRHQAEQGVRALLELKDPDSTLVQSELKRLNGEIKSLDGSIRGLEASSSTTRQIELSEVSKALQQLDPVWDVLYPEERRRVLELLVDSVSVTRESVDISFRTTGIEQMVDELTPMVER